jgi:four helix bundle protein
VNGHRNLEIWKLAGELIDAVYAVAAGLPGDERYVAAQQLRRAVWSVQNNIAEGNARRGPRELRRFLDVSLGSLGEIDSMVAKLSTMYGLDSDTLVHIDSLRKRITAGIFRMTRRTSV